MHNADVMIREDVSTDDVIDAILGNRKYVPCLCVLFLCTPVLLLKF